MSRLIVILGLLISVGANAQIDHWESIIPPGHNWQYSLPTTELPSAWKTLNYNSIGWNTGPSGFGYNDDDDATIIPTTISVFLRTTFEVVELDDIEEVYFNMDFDDGFVAYLNGVEIARSFVNGIPPAYNQPSSGFHEAVLYTGGTPDGYPVNLTLLNEGTNILAVQVHNENISSSDFSALPVLSVGINNNSSNYSPTPSWFNAPVSFGSSNLPVVKVNTLGQSINGSFKINAEFGIVNNGPGMENSFTGIPNEYVGNVGIKIRGESSSQFDKKSYAIEMWDGNQNDIDTSFLDFPKEEDFILYGPYSDKTLMNNVLAMKFGNQMGQYASRTEYVELTINDAYQGVYVLMEKIKRDNDRVDIAKLDSADISGEDLTGGYIVRIDKGVYDGWFSNYNIQSNTNKLYFQYYYPNQEDILPEQKEYIQQYFDDFERAIIANNGIHPNGKHYSEYINLRSFIDAFILNELSKNVDAYRLSTYFHKKKNGKVHAGPFWDFNLAFGNGDYCSGDDIAGWLYYQCPGNSPFWWDRFLGDATFIEALNCRWEELRGSFLSNQSLTTTIDSMATILAEPAARNFERWQILGQYNWPNPDYFATATTYASVINTLSTRLIQRANWIDNNLPGLSNNCNIYDEDFELTTDLSETIQPTSRPRIFPNPTSNSIHIESALELTNIQLINTLGQLVYKKIINASSAQITLPESLVNGIYLITINTEEETFVERVLIER